MIKKVLIVAALTLVLIMALPGGVVLVPSLRTATMESVTQAVLSADRVTIGAIEVGDRNDLVVSGTAVETRHGRFDVGRVAMTPQLWRGLWSGQGPLDYVNQVRVENVAGRVDAFGRDLPLQLLDLTVQDRAVRHSVAVTASDPASSTDEADTARPGEAADEEATTTVLRSRLLVRGQPIDIEIEIDARKLLTGAPTEFTAYVTAELINIEAKGVVRDPEALAVEGEFSVTTGAMDELAAWILGEAPAELAGLGAFDGAGKLSMEGQVMRLADLRLDLIDSQVRGDLTVTGGGDVTGVDGQFTIDRLDFNRLMAAMPADNTSAAEAPAEQGDGEIDVAFLDGLKGLIKINVAEVLAGPVVASDMGLDLKFEPGRLDLQALLQVLGGEARLAGQVISDDGAPGVTATLSLARFLLAEAVRTFAGPDSGLEVAGALSAETKVSTRGGTARELEAALTLSASASVEGLGVTAGAPILRDGSLKLALSDLKTAPTLTGEAVLFERALNLSAEAVPLSALMMADSQVERLLDVALSSGEHRLAAQVDAGAGDAGPVVAVSASGSSMADLLAWLQSAPAPEAMSESAVMGQYSLAALVEPGGDGVAVKDIALRLDEVALDGRADLALGGDKPALHLRLAGDRLDLTPYLAAPGAADPPAPAPLSAGKPDDPDMAGSAALADFDASIELKLNAITADKIVVGPTQLMATVADGAATVDLDIAEVYGGSVKLTAGLRGGGADVPINGRLVFEAIDPGTVLRTMFGVEGFGGAASGEFRVASSGGKLSELQRRLEANGQFAIENAEVPPQFALLTANPLAAAKGTEEGPSRISGVLLYGRDSRRADMQWQRGDDIVAEFSLFEKKKNKRETRLKRTKQRDG